MKETHTTNRNSSTLSDALWLAGHDIRASWLSYPATFLIAGFFGLIGVVQFQSALEADAGVFTVGVLDFYLLCIVSALGTNLVFNRDYFAGSTPSSFDERLSFLRSLPVSRRSTVTARTLCSLLAMFCAGPSCFAVPYLLSGNLREVVGVGAYLCFCCFWIGYALVATGLLYIYNGFAVRLDRAKMPLAIGQFLGAGILIPVAFRVVSGDGLTLTVLRLVEVHGLVLAGASLLVGAVVLVICMRKAESGLARKEIG